MKHCLLLLMMFCLLGVTPVGAQSKDTVVRLSPKLDKIVPANAKIEELATGFGFVEGPVWVHDGYLLFSDIPRNVILKWAPGSTTSVFRNQSGYDKPGPDGAFIGSNGLTLDKQGRLTICEHGNR